MAADLGWSSSDPDIVSVSDAGGITALAAGEAVIFAAAQNESYKYLRSVVTVANTSPPNPDTPTAPDTPTTPSNPSQDDIKPGSHCIVYFRALPDRITHNLYYLHYIFIVEEYGT
ncbi:MAG: Ig-like domain-containing protein [Synergistaceae bacterium]|nr:Ig-like domain-containing protein [Synergistaceae bacterium]